jgi:hypothetical protein
MSDPAPSGADVNRCIKCGREIDRDESMCELCNRAGMATPSASQYHGTVVVAIIAAVAALAIAASLSLRGVGPYSVEVTAVTPAGPAGYEVTIDVTNEGSAEGRARCRIVALGASGRQLAARPLVTGPVPPGESLTVTERLPTLEVEPSDVTAECS